jgi:hypothetical protein
LGCLFSKQKLTGYVDNNAIVSFAEKTSQKLVTALPIFRFFFPRRKGFAGLCPAPA